MGLTNVLTRVQRLSDGVKRITIDNDETPPTIIVDAAFSTTSENPVQNKVITTKIIEQEASIVDLTTQVDNKVTKSEQIRKIYIGSEETPSSSLGQDGDLYIYSPY